MKMKWNTNTIQLLKSILWILTWSFSLSVWAQVPSPVKNYPSSVLILGGTAHVGNGEVIENSAISIQDGKFVFVKSKSNKRIAEDIYDTVIRLTNEHIYPGFILTDNTLGITEIDALRQTRDFDDVGQFNPNLRTAVAYNPGSKIIYTVRNNGVLTAQVTPRGGVVSGASSIMRLDAWNYEDAVIKMVDGFHLNWPARFTQSGAWYNAQPIKKSHNTDERIQSIVDYFKSAKAYYLTDNPKINLKYESLKSVFEGSTNLYVHCNMSKEILQVINFKKELGIKNVVIVGGYDSGLLPVQLKENNISVILRKVHTLPVRPDDDPYYSYKLPAILQKNGILFCLGSAGDMEAMNSRNLPFWAGEASGFGLSKEEALQSITLNAAKILGIDSLLGSLEAGKQATLFISTGDALDMRTNNVVFGWIDGCPIVLDDTQKQLYRKYSEKYSK